VDPRLRSLLGTRGRGLALRGLPYHPRARRDARRPRPSTAAHLDPRLRAGDDRLRRGHPGRGDREHGPADRHPGGQRVGAHRAGASRPGALRAALPQLPHAGRRQGVGRGRPQPRRAAPAQGPRPQRHRRGPLARQRPDGGRPGRRRGRRGGRRLRRQGLRRARGI
ncbi:MAG: hypothetical protein AVDCRST_MAG38-2073, partial [uncultured Solirubrobacteraceae bacterium]